MSKTLAHKLVAKTAQEAAGQLYELVMSDNEVRAEWLRRNPGLGPRQLEARFIAKYCEACLPMARATLATMLRNPSLDPALGEAIVEALALDARVPGRTPRGQAIQLVQQPNGADSE